MTKKLSCEQIASLIEFYADGTLHNLLKNCVTEHLENCPDCMAKYISLKELIEKSEKEKAKEDITPQNSEQYALFKKKLSAYLDNELDDLDSFKMKKFTISNPVARADLEKMLLFKKLLSDSFEKTKNDVKIDFSKLVSSKIQQELQINTAEPFYKIAALLFLMLFILITGFITLLYF